MNRHEEALAHADELLADIELSRTSTAKHVLKAMRVARLLNDAGAQRWLGYELDGVPSGPDGQAWMTTTKRWADKDAGEGYWGSSASLEAARDNARSIIKAHSGSVSLSGDYVTIAMRERSGTIARTASTANALDRVLSSVESHVYRFAADVHAELTYSQVQANLFEASREAVDATLASMAGDALKSIASISERLNSGDESAVSQAMTTCRQLIDAVADHVFPPAKEPYKIGEQDLDVTANRVLNRLQAHLHESGVTGGRATRLRRTLGDLYDRVSASVHRPGGVDVHEARYLFLAVYTALGEVLTLGPDDRSKTESRAGDAIASDDR
ncbi:hypothetical protein [Actinotalea sp. K2]|uniref:AbiTii domain-containing protein n=1 Tax=Actinotalea sp. K2 TaxID=2939438 RepID=UPI0020177D7D|nr:hypothetical protein [Actinotalea sp. K2]MCL3863035.1 hypothetical protein [Actinotalea sp. K2]